MSRGCRIVRLIAKLGKELEQPWLDHRSPSSAEPGDDPLQGAYELRTVGAADQPVDLAFVRDGACPSLAIRLPAGVSVSV